jgi:hypothetical protein
MKVTVLNTEAIDVSDSEILTLWNTVVIICITYLNIQKLHSLPTQCIYMFRMILTINSDYFLKQDYPSGLCSGEVMCFLWGTDWTVTYYLEGLHVWTMKMNIPFNLWRRLSVTMGPYWPRAVRVSYSLGIFLHSRESLRTAPLLTSRNTILFSRELSL